MASERRTRLDPVAVLILFALWTLVWVAAYEAQPMVHQIASTFAYEYEKEGEVPW